MKDGIKKKKTTVTNSAREVDEQEGYVPMFSPTQHGTRCQKLEHDRRVGRAWEGKLLAHSLAEVHRESVRNIFSISRPQ